MKSLHNLGLLLGMAVFGPTSLRAADLVTVETNTIFQTIRAWGAPTGGLDVYSDALIGALFDEMVFSLGLNRARLEPRRRGNEDPLNDNADPFHTDPAAFSMDLLDSRAARLYLPFKQRVEARGERFEWYMSPSFFNNGSSGSAPLWMTASPGEFAEWYLVTALHLRQRHHLRPHFFVICNEAGNDNGFTTPLVASLIKTLAPRLEALGFTGRFQFPESVSAASAWSALQSAQSDAELWRWVGLTSYHLYGDNTARTNIRQFALTRNLPTAQTEYMGVSLNILYDDLTQGGVSRWETYAMSDFLPVNSSQTWFSRNATYWQLRQVTQFVRPGAVRLGATSANPNLRALAFLRDGTMVVVLLNTTDGLARTVDLTGLLPGAYARSQVAGSTQSELGLVRVPDSGALTTSLPANSVLTLYPHGGTNHPPVIRNWAASPSFLTRPANSTALSAIGADPELAAVTYHWTVVSQPAGAVVSLSASNAANCSASGMNVAGDYLFQVAFSDGTNRVTRPLPVSVFASNQPPEIRDLHNRRPVNVILPINSTTLRAFAFDRNADAPGYQWSLVSQPPGAAGTLVTPTATSCVATNLDLPGRYVFRIAVTAGPHSVQADHTVIVQPTNRPPVISSAIANPPSLTAPSNSTTLRALTSDLDGDVISHWWTLPSGPAGARPVFSNQGSTNTLVKGLILPGTYTFRLTAVDRAAAVTRDVTVTVSAGTNPPQLFLAAPNGGESFTASQQVWIRWASSSVAGNVKLEWLDGAAWQTIAAVTANDGAERWTLPHGNFTGCKVRVLSLSDGGILDESDGAFSITAEAPRFLNFHRTGGGDVNLQFEQQAGATNLLQRSFTLQSNDWQTLGAFNGEAQDVLFTDPAAQGQPRAFYRVSGTLP